MQDIRNAVQFSFDYLGLMCVISKSRMTAKLLNVTNAGSKSTVNLSQRRQTRQSTHHTILQCDELTVWRVDWFAKPYVLKYSTSSLTISIGILLTHQPGYCEIEIHCRIALGKEAFMNKKKLFLGNLSIKLKNITVKSVLWSVVLYASETWTMTQADR